MTSIRADVDQKFIRRFLFVAIGCFLFMLWSLYDSVYKAPNNVKRAIAYQELLQRQEGGELTESERAIEWDTITEENGWESTKPDSPENERKDVQFQWFLFTVGLLGSIFFLVKYLRLKNTWVEADDAQLTTSWGRELKFENIAQIDKRKWTKKGIAKIQFADASGKSSTMVMDDFKYQREKMAEIMKLAEANLTDDQIVGGMREATKAQSSTQSVMQDAAEDSNSTSEEK